jgi:ABC-type transporter Mla subunit MlaD
MATRNVSATNLIAGGFVLASLVLAVLISIWIAGARDALIPKHQYVIRFSLEQGAGGLSEGSAVTLGGQPVGRVVAVRFLQPVSGHPPEAIDVRVAINADITLYEDALVFMERPLLGNASIINIAAAGDGSTVRQPQGGDPILQPGEVLHGTIAPPAFLAQAGYGPDQIRQFRLMVAEASEAAERVNRIAGRLESELGPAIEGIKQSVEDVNAVTAEVRGHTPQWTQRIDSLLEKAEDFAGRLDPTADQFTLVIEKADEAITEIRDIVRENRQSVNNFVAELERAGVRVNETLTSVQQGADEFAHAGRGFNIMLQEQLPNIRRILANFRLASDQIKLTGIEVRRNPWRLLYQPTTRELESEVFFDAARTYAEAVSDLRAASESIESVAAAGQVVPPDEAQRLHERLRAAFEVYNRAEQTLLDQLIRRAR